VTSDNQFTALGPAIIGFQTFSNAIDKGAEISGNSIGVLGKCSIGVGIRGESQSNDGVTGETSNAGRSGVWGNNTGNGFGVSGSSKGGPGVAGRSNNNDGVTGQSSVPGRSGVWGNNTGNRFGVSGSSSNGYGGSFRGGQAPLFLSPSNTNGSPTTGSHFMGEFVVDRGGALYFCTQSGTPGTWKRFQLL
jgi:hypothetical protein